MEVTQPKPRYDAVIIGSGVGGLTAAALLSKAGLTVCVLEKEPHPGGYLAGFCRKDFRFDTAVHWLNQYAEDGMVCRLFNALGNDYPRAVTQKGYAVSKATITSIYLPVNRMISKSNGKKNFRKMRMALIISSGMLKR